MPSGGVPVATVETKEPVDVKFAVASLYVRPACPARIPALLYITCVVAPGAIKLPENDVAYRVPESVLAIKFAFALSTRLLVSPLVKFR